MPAVSQTCLPSNSSKCICSSTVQYHANTTILCIFEYLITFRNALAAVLYFFYQCPLCSAVIKSSSCESSEYSGYVTFLYAWKLTLGKEISTSSMGGGGWEGKKRREEERHFCSMVLNSNVM